MTEGKDNALTSRGRGAGSISYPKGDYADGHHSSFGERVATLVGLVARIRDGKRRDSLMAHQRAMKRESARTSSVRFGRGERGYTGKQSWIMALPWKRDKKNSGKEV